MQKLIWKEEKKKKKCEKVDMQTIARTMTNHCWFLLSRPVLTWKGKTTEEYDDHRDRDMTRK